MTIQVVAALYERRSRAEARLYEDADGTLTTCRESLIHEVERLSYHCYDNRAGHKNN